MRILHVIEFVTPSKGGSVRVARSLAAGLAGRGHEVELWSSTCGEPPPIEGVRLRTFPGPNFSGLYVTPSIALSALARIDRFDIVHFHNLRSIQNLIVAAAARRKSVPYVISPHGSLGANGQKVLGKRFFDTVGRTARLISGAAAIAPVSQPEAEQCRLAGIDTRKMFLTLNPVELGPDEPVSVDDCRSCDPWEEAPTVGYLGRLEASKRIDLLIAAFAQARARRPELRLDIAGPDQGDEQRLRRLITQSGLGSSVRFRGPVEGEAKWAFLARCSVLASPCPFEVFGLASLEAVAQGAPVVVARGSGGASLIEQSGAGCSVDPEDSAVFAEALLEQMDVPASIRSDARGWVRRMLSSEAYLDRVETMYASVMEGRMGSPDPGEDDDVQVRFGGSWVGVRGTDTR